MSVAPSVVEDASAAIITPPPRLAPPSAAAVPPAGLSPAAVLGTDAGFWARVNEVGARNRRARVVLADARPESVAGDVVTLAVKPALLGYAQQSVPDLEAVLAEAAGRTLRVVLRAAEETPSPPAEAPRPDATPTIDIQHHPLVKRAIEAFDGKLVGTSARRKPPAT